LAIKHLFCLSMTQLKITEITICLTTLSCSVKHGGAHREEDAGGQGGAHVTVVNRNRYIRIQCCHGWDVKAK